MLNLRGFYGNRAYATGTAAHVRSWALALQKYGRERPTTKKTMSQ